LWGAIIEQPGFPVQSQYSIKWFTPLISQEDFFVTPDFDLGQIFFTHESARRLVAALDHYQRPCCVCTPRLAAEWQKKGRTVRLLEYDKRFNTIPGFRHFDLLKPEPSEEDFDVIVYDPVFIDAVRLARALKSVATASNHPDLFMCFPVDRESELLKAFSDFDLRRTSFRVLWCNVKPENNDLFALYGTKCL
jgi:hypothetical protein